MNKSCGSGILYKTWQLGKKEKKKEIPNSIAQNSKEDERKGAKGKFGFSHVLQRYMAQSDRKYQKPSKSSSAVEDAFRPTRDPSATSCSLLLLLYMFNMYVRIQNRIYVQKWRSIKRKYISVYMKKKTYLAETSFPDAYPTT